MTPAPSNLPCPRCSHLLFAGTASGLTLHGCGTCGGVWLSKACAERLEDKLPADALALADSATTAAQHHPETSRAVACPQCRATAKRVTKQGIEVDTCDEHGTWYDRDEIRRITEAIKARPGAGSVVADIGIAVAVEGVLTLLFEGLLS